jgi:hypothetical protein
VRLQPLGHPSRVSLERTTRVDLLPPRAGFAWRPDDALHREWAHYNAARDKRKRASQNPMASPPARLVCIHIGFIYGRGFEFERIKQQWPLA